MSSSQFHLAKRFEGRLFPLSGKLCLVTEIDCERDLARVSCRIDGRAQILEMTIMEVADHLTKSADLKLDNINSDETKKRLRKQKDGWFFDSREGPQGPFQSKREGAKALNDYIVETQDESLETVAH